MSPETSQTVVGSICQYVQKQLPNQIMMMSPVTPVTSEMSLETSEMSPETFTTTPKAFTLFAISSGTLTFDILFCMGGPPTTTTLSQVKSTSIAKPERLGRILLEGTESSPVDFESQQYGDLRKSDCSLCLCLVLCIAFACIALHVLHIPSRQLQCVLLVIVWINQSNRSRSPGVKTRVPVQVFGSTFKLSLSC